MKEHVRRHEELPSFETCKKEYGLSLEEQPEPPSFYYDKLRTRFVKIRLIKAWEHCNKQLADDPLEALEHFWEACSSLQTAAGSKASDAGVEVISSAQILSMESPATEWVVKGRLPAFGLSVLGGKPKAGKSTLARGLAIAVSRGTPWLGFETVQGKVLYVNLEVHATETKRLFTEMGLTELDEVHFVHACGNQVTRGRRGGCSREAPPRLGGDRHAATVASVSPT